MYELSAVYKGRADIFFIRDLTLICFLAFSLYYRSAKEYVFEASSFNALNKPRELFRNAKEGDTGYYVVHDLGFFLTTANEKLCFAWHPFCEVGLAHCPHTDVSMTHEQACYRPEVDNQCPCTPLPNRGSGWQDVNPRQEESSRGIAWIDDTQILVHLLISPNISFPRSPNSTEGSSYRCIRLPFGAAPLWKRNRLVKNSTISRIVAYLRQDHLQFPSRNSQNVKAMFISRL